MSNLLSPIEKRSLRRMYRKRILSLFFLGLSALVMIGAVLLLPPLFFLKTSEKVLTEQRDTLASHETNKIASSLAATVADINARLSVFPDTITTASPIIAGLIDPVLKVKTNTVHIDSLTYTVGDDKTVPAQIQIAGSTDSRDDLLSFADKLRKSGSFSDVTVPISSFIKDSNVTFTISATAVVPK